MIRFVTGDLFLSDAYALVNAVNCEGVMGKGIAYQFKRRYPDNFEAYRKACSDGRLRPGNLFASKESGKLIINFPTKDKWRNPSRISYIDEGLSALADLIRNEAIPSVAIPPLGAGNGGLVWRDVRKLMKERLYSVSDRADISIYEPSKASGTREACEPRLGVSGLVLLEIMSQLRAPVNKERVKKVCRLLNFTFEGDDFDRAYAGVQAFKRFHHIRSASEARDILYRQIVSDSVERTLKRLFPAISDAVQSVNLEKERRFHGFQT